MLCQVSKVRDLHMLFFIWSIEAGKSLKTGIDKDHRDVVYSLGSDNELGDFTTSSG